MEEINTNRFEQLATEILLLDEFGFTKSAHTHEVLIYNSQWCRVAFYIDNLYGHRHHVPPSLDITYARLHAPDYKLDNLNLMKWNGEDCYCWQSGFNIDEILHFIDGYFPISYEDVKQKERKHHRLKNNLFTITGKKHPSNSVEMMQYHNLIWQEYGIRFFEVFDLRRPDIWDKYLVYLKTYNQFKYQGVEIPNSYNPSYYPPYYKQC